MATRTITTRLALTGDGEYRSKITGINASLGSLNSNLKLVQSEYQNHQNSVTALSAKSEALRAVQQAQIEKVNTLRAALENAKNAQTSYAAQQDALRQKISGVETTLNSMSSSTINAGRQWASYKAEVDAAKDELDKLRKAGGDTAQQQAELEAKIRTGEAAMATLEKSTDGAAKTAGELLIEQRGLKTELKEAEAYEQAAANGVANYERQLNNAQISLNNTSAELERTDKYLDEAKKSADGCATSIDEMGRSAKDAGEDGSQAMSDLAEVIGSLGLVQMVKELASAFGECYEEASAFEYGMAKVETLADTTSAAWATMADDIMDLSYTYGRSAADLSEAAYQALSASVDTGHAVDFLEQATKLSIGGYTSATSAVDILTTVLNAYRMEASETAHISDVLVQTQNLGKTSVDQLAQSMGMVIPTAAAYNVSLENLAAGYAVMTKNGIATANSSTYLSGMFTELADEGSTVAAILKQKTGKSFSELSAEGKSLGDIMAILLGAVDGNTTAFANLWSNTRAGRAALTIAQTGTEEYSRTLQSMINSAGTADRAYTIMANTSQAAGERMRTSAQNLKVAVGDVLEPSLRGLEEIGAGAFRWMADVVEDSPGLVAAVAGVGAGIAALAGTLGVIKLATTAISVLGGALNPTVAIIAAVGAGAVALGTAFGILSAQSDSLANHVRDLRKEIAESAESYEQQRKATDDAAASTAATAHTLFELAQEEHKSAAVKQQLLALVDQLNEAVPELNLAYDEQADVLNLTAQQVDALIQKQYEYSQYTDAIQRRTELYAEQQKLLEQQAAAQQALSDAEANYTPQYDSFSGAEIWTHEKQAYDDARQAVADLNEMLAANQTEYAAAGEAIDAYAASTAEATEEVKKTSSAVLPLNQDLQDLADEYAEAKAAALDSMQSQFKLWEQVGEIADLSADDLLSALESQAKYWTDYQTNIQTVLNSGVAGIEDYVAAVADGSTDSAAVLAALASATDDEKAKIVAAWRQMQQSQESTAGSMPQVSTAHRKMVQQMIQQTRDANIARDMELMGKGAVTGAVSGIQSQQPTLRTALTALGNVGAQAFAGSLSPTQAAVAAKNLITSAITASKTQQTPLGTAFKGVGAAGTSGFTSGLNASTGVQRVKDAIKAAASAATGQKSAVQKAFSAVASAGADAAQAKVTASAGSKIAGNFWQGFIDGTKNKRKAVVASTSAAGSKITSALNKSIGNASPSKIARKSAHDFYDGFLLGSADRTNTLIKSSERQAQAVTGGFNPALNVDVTASARLASAAAPIHAASAAGTVASRVQGDLVNSLLDAMRTVGRSGDTIVEVRVGDDRLIRKVVDGINSETARTGHCPICV